MGMKIPFLQVSSEQTFTIASGATGSAVTAVDLGRPYREIIIRCEDCSNIQASTNIAALVGYNADDTLCDLYAEDDPGAQWSKGAIPATGTLAFVLKSARGAQYLRLVLSKAASGGSVVFKIRGMTG